MQQAPASFLPTTAVAHWLADRTEPTSDPASVGIQELYADYAEWCARTSILADAQIAFAAEFDRVRALPEVASKIRKFGRRYYGLRLLRASEMRQLTGTHNA